MSKPSQSFSRLPSFFQDVQGDAQVHQKLLKQFNDIENEIEKTEHRRRLTTELPTPKSPHNYSPHQNQNIVNEKIDPTNFCTSPKNQQLKIKDFTNIDELLSQAQQYLISKREELQDNAEIIEYDQEVLDEKLKTLEKQRNLLLQKIQKKEGSLYTSKFSKLVNSMRSTKSSNIENNESEKFEKNENL